MIKRVAAEFPQVSRHCETPQAMRLNPRRPGNH